MPDKKLTNYDRIRNMSVEELVALLDICDNELPPYCIYKNIPEYYNSLDCDGRCLSCAKQWLESEVDTNG